MEQNTFIFIAGLHRSGTTILGDTIKEHPDISGLENTGVSMNEGQLVQTVYPAAKEFGGPGKFGFAPEMHLTESSELISEENKRQLLKDWEQYWDSTKKVLVEKSPPNLLKTRFLQRMFPNSIFVVIKRHPIAVTLATKKRWKNSSVEKLIQHWIHCHEIYTRDKAYLKNVIEFTYSELISFPNDYLKIIYDSCGLDYYVPENTFSKDINNKYFVLWKKWMNRPWNKQVYKRLIENHETDVNEHGFSLIDY